MIVLHGGPGVSHAYMRPLLALASWRYRTVFYDQRGVGQSSKPQNGYGLDPQAADLEAIRLWTGALRVHLVCHSTGGILCMAYAATHREQVASMTLIASLPASDTEYLASTKVFAAALAAAKAKGLVPHPEPPVAGNDCAAQLIARLPVYYHDPKHPATADLAGSSCHANVGPPFRMELLWNGYDLRPQLANYDRPLLIIHGASDPFGRGTFEAIVKAFPHAIGGFAYLEECGHIPWEECSERFWSILLGFFSKLPS